MKNTDTAGFKGYDAGKKVSGIKRHIAVDTPQQRAGLPINAEFDNIDTQRGTINERKNRAAAAGRF